jgi:hypothetical protein
VSQEAQDLEEVQLEKGGGGGSFRNLWKCCTGGSPTTEGPIPLGESHPITTIAEAPEPPSSSVPTPHGPINPRQSKSGFVRTDSGGHISRVDYMAFLADPNHIPTRHN